MTMNSEIPDSTVAAAPDTIPPRPSDLLRTLLDKPKPKDEVWQEAAARAVSMLAVGFLNEPDEEAALRAVALLALAQSLGVKEARKRAIKLSRWATTAPPPLSVLALKDEQEAALVALPKLATVWARPYAEQALADPSLPDEFVPDLLRWARTTFADTLGFTRDFCAPQVAAGRSPLRTAILLKEAAKLLKPLKPEAATKLAECTSALIGALCEATPVAAADKKAFGNCVVALLHVAQDQAAAMPAVLLQPAFVMAVDRLSEVASKGSAAKQVAAGARGMSHATVSLLMADLERSGRQAADHWKAMVPMWRSAYPGWDKAITAAAAVSPAMGALDAQGEHDAPASPDAYASEAVFARLLPAWDAFVADLPDASRALSLSAMLQQAARTVGVVPMGESGAVVAYDPLSHHLAVEGAEVPGQVRIVRPGVQVVRPDGSARVLVAALVAAA